LLKNKIKSLPGAKKKTPGKEIIKKIKKSFAGSLPSKLPAKKLLKKIKKALPRACPVSSWQKKSGKKIKNLCQVSLTQLPAKKGPTEPAP